MQLKISGRIGLIFSGLIVILLLCGGAGLYGKKILSDGLDYISTTAWDAADGAMEGVISIQEQVILIHKLAATPNEQKAQEIIGDINAAKETANEAIERMIATQLFDNQLVSELNNFRKEFADAQKKLLATTSKLRAADTLFEEEQVKESLNNAETHFNNVVDRLLSFLAKMEETGDGAVENYTNTVNESKNQAQNLIIATLVLGFLLSAASFIIIQKTVVTPIKAMAIRFLDLSQGEGDLTISMPAQGNDEIADVNRGFNLFAAKIRNTIQEVIQSSHQLNSASDELSQISSTTSHSLSIQQQETEQVATAMNEMVATVQEVARNVSDAAESAHSANDEAQNGKQIVAGSIDEINTLASEIQQAASAVAKLEKDSDNIGSVLVVIKDIADQTNLLALNAAIEAARAGEQGRGFAVVADEVRTLASRTQQSTEEIQAMIESLQSGARQAVGVMEKSQERAQSSVDQANNAGHALESITVAVGTITNMTAQIASAAEEQNAVAEEVNANIVNINSMSQETAKGASQITHATSQLASLSQQLQGIVNQFKV